MLEDQRLQRIVERGGKDLFHARVQREPVFPLKRSGARLGKVDEVGQQAETAELVRIVARADGGNADDICHAKTVQRVDVCAVVDLAGVKAVEHAVARQKDELMPIQCGAEYDDVAIGRGYGLLVVWDGKRFDVGAADDGKLHGYRPPKWRLMCIYEV